MNFASCEIRERGNRGRRGSAQYLTQGVPIISFDLAGSRANQYSETNCQFMLSRYYAVLIIARGSPRANPKCTRIVIECILPDTRRNGSDVVERSRRLPPFLSFRQAARGSAARLRTCVSAGPPANCAQKFVEREHSRECLSRLFSLSSSESVRRV